MEESHPFQRWTQRAVSGRSIDGQFESETVRNGRGRQNDEVHTHCPFLSPTKSHPTFWLQEVVASVDDGEQQTLEKATRLVWRPSSLFHLLDVHRPGAHHVHRPHHLRSRTRRCQSAQTLRIGIISSFDDKVTFVQTFRVVQVLVTSLSLQEVDYYEPSNFWIGPRAVRPFPVFVDDNYTPICCCA